MVSGFRGSAADGHAAPMVQNAPSALRPRMAIGLKTPESPLTQPARGCPPLQVGESHPQAVGGAATLAGAGEPASIGTMKYAMIMAGGSGTRLWPMSRAGQPKQLIPFIQGRSLLQIAMQRLEGLVDPEHCYICAGESHRAATLEALPALDAGRFLAEPEGRDTLNAVGYGAAVIAHRDPEAMIAVFTADHIIEPVDTFQRIVEHGYELAGRDDHTLVTFGVTPSYPATGFGYLALGEALGGYGGARQVNEFKEKPSLAQAQRYLDAGPARYLWNSGMFVWKAKTLLDCIERYQPANAAALHRIAEAFDTPNRDTVLSEVYPTLKKVSVDYAVMEPASQDPDFDVVAVPMPLTWLDVGSWPSFAETCERDEHDNAIAATHLGLDSSNNLVASSDSEHLIATVGCKDLLIVHTPDATLVCHRDHAEQIKQLHGMVTEQYGEKLT